MKCQTCVSIYAMPHTKRHVYNDNSVMPQHNAINEMQPVMCNAHIDVTTINMMPCMSSYVCNFNEMSFMWCHACDNTISIPRMSFLFHSFTSPPKLSMHRCDGVWVWRRHYRLTCDDCVTTKFMDASLYGHRVINDGWRLNFFWPKNVFWFFFEKQ